MCSGSKPESEFYESKARCKACMAEQRAAREPRRRCGGCSRIRDRAEFDRYARRCRDCGAGVCPPDCDVGGGDAAADATEDAATQLPDDIPAATASFLRRLTKNTRWRAKELHRKRWPGTPFEFDVTVETCTEMWTRQGGLCAISGLPMTTSTGRGPGLRRTRAQNASVDRVDSARNYGKANVHLVCCAVNVMKAQLDLDEFQRLCCSVAARCASDPGDAERPSAPPQTSPSRAPPDPEGLRDAGQERRRE